MVVDTPRLLLLSQDVNYSALLAETLSARQFRVDSVSVSDIAVERLRKQHYDICIIDANNARAVALQTVRDIRDYNNAIPILLLSLRNERDDIVEGYRAGCSEYVLSPCPVDVMICKLQSWLRTLDVTHDNDATLTFGQCLLDTNTCTLTCDDKSYNLSYRQAGILQLLVTNRGRLVDKRTILRRLWHDDNVFAARSLNVYISGLRRLLAADNNLRIVSIRNKGYRLDGC